MRRFLPSAGLAAAVSLVALASCTTGCTPPRIVPAAPAPAIPVPAPTPSPPPVVAAPSGDWRDWPVTPGTWVYRQDGRGAIALYGQGGADAEFTIRCDLSRRKIYLSRRGSARPGGLPMTIRTSSMLRPVTALPVGDAEPYLAVELEPRDPLLDAMGHSRGRFVVETATMPPLVIPAWSEVLRVIEDCRG